MTARPFADKTSERNAMWLFVGMVAIAYVSTLAMRPADLLSFRDLVMVILGLIYIFAGTYGERWCGLKGNQWVLPGYFVFQVILSALIIYLGWDYSGFMFLIIFPLVSQATIAFPLWGAAIVAGSILLYLIIPSMIAGDWQGVIQSGTGILTAMVFVILFTRIAARENTARLEIERLAGELKAANQKLREYAVQIEELATTQERNRLAREIHDSLGHYLTVVNVQLEAAKTVLAHDPTRALSALEKAQTLTKNGLAEVRRSVAALRASPIDNLALPEAMQPLLAECRTGGIEAELTISGSPGELDPKIKLTLYRVAQEGLTNVRKHAQASRVDVTLDYANPGAVRLTVQDDGAGAESQNEADGFGLLGIRERVNLLGGEVQTWSKPGEGFTLDVQLPISTKETVTDGANSNSTG